LHYSESNINSLVYLLKELARLEVPISFIFSSSYTVYGQDDSMTIKEDAPVKAAEPPYGNTKQIVNEMLKDLSVANANINSILIRYFKPNRGTSFAGNTRTAFGEAAKFRAFYHPNRCRFAREGHSILSRLPCY
jgi:UDP-glucose 4-epimerase